MGLKGCLLDDHTPQGVPAVQGMWQEFCTDVSLADFFVLTAEALIEKTLPANQAWLGQELRAQFRFGRTTAATCHNPALPNPEESCHAVEKNFVNSLGLTWRKATALMGVHTLGRASPENSGFDGPWVHGGHANSFNNHYYLTLAGAAWTPHTVSPGKVQWRRADGGPADEMMLNTDMCLAWHTNRGVVASQEGNACLWSTSQGMDGVPCQCNLTKFGDCTDFGRAHANCCEPQLGIAGGNSPSSQGVGIPHPESAQAVKEFAKDERAWLQVFQAAWKDTTELGATSLCGNAQVG